jgi:hypothetical protein
MSLAASRAKVKAPKQFVPEHLLEGASGGQQGRVHGGDSRIIEQRVQAVVTPAALPYHGRDRLFVPDVERSMRIGLMVDGGFPAAATSDAPALVKVVTRQMCTDAFARASDENDG